MKSNVNAAGLLKESPLIAFHLKDAFNVYSKRGNIKIYTRKLHTLKNANVLKFRVEII